ncbi:MAG: cadherin repeat domain-containing protein [Nitrospirae bacterium]|nr:MAG: cadherin repeat domain-containing protein [Nitrospirota bacterium]
MKKYIRIILITVLILPFILFAFDTSEAITVTATPNPSVAGQNVAISAAINFADALGCTLQVNYGDGSPVSDFGICAPGALNCTLNGAHTYSTVGTYTISIGSKAGFCVAPPSAPNPGTRSLVVNCTTRANLSSTTIPVARKGQSFSYQLPITGGIPPYSVSLLAAAPPPGLTLSTTGLLSGTPTTTGSFAMPVLINDSCPVFITPSAIPLTVSVQCPVITSPSPTTLTAATIGVPYSFVFQGSGGQPPYIFQDFGDAGPSIPPGLTLSSSGTLSGVPPTAGTFGMIIGICDSCGGSCLVRNYSLTVNPCPAMSISTASLPPGTAGQSYFAQLQASGAQGRLTYNIAAGQLPGGLTLDSSTGAISGIPSATGNYSFTVSARDTCASGPRTVQRDFTLSVTTTPSTPSCVPPVITSPLEMPAASTGQAYSAQLQASGGTPPLSFSLAGGTLTPGLSLSPSGNIIGVPSASGNFSFSVRVSDSCPGGSQSAQGTFSIRVQSSSSGSLAAVTVPSFFSVPRGRNSSAGITHQFTGDPATRVTLQSPTGVFLLNGDILDVNAIPLTAVVANGRGQVSESVVIPVRILERALQRGSNRFTYERVFEGSGFSYVSNVNFTITSEAGADFSLVNINLYFENRRPEITVLRNQTDLQAFADIRFMGSGLLQGFWEVDGRVLSYVNQHLTYGSNITLQSRMPALPTFDPGNHVVRFVVTRPAATIPVPEASYYVTPDEARPKPVVIALLAPADKAAPDRQKLVFEWEKYGSAALYLVQFFDAPEAKPIFTAYTKDGTYSIPATFMNRMFEAGKTYHWKVTGYDAKNNITGDSALRSFMLQKP